MTTKTGQKSDKPVAPTQERQQWERYVYKPNVMPGPPVEEATELIEAGAITIGVEYRLTGGDIGKAAFGEEYYSKVKAKGGFGGADGGVTLHVYENAGGKLIEHLRFDCFDEAPHYHYMNQTKPTQELRVIHPSLEGDPLDWSLDRLRTRLPQMLAYVDAGKVAAKLDKAVLEEAMPRIAEAAYRARYHSDKGEIRRGAEAARGMAVLTKW